MTSNPLRNGVSSNEYARTLIYIYIHMYIYCVYIIRHEICIDSRKVLKGCGVAYQILLWRRSLDSMKNNLGKMVRGAGLNSRGCLRCELC